MALAQTKGASIEGIVTVVPSQTEDNSLLDLFTETERESLITHTGIRYRRIVPTGVRFVDYVQKATEILCEKLEWSSDSIDVFITVTQSPDQPLPGVSCDVHGKLGMSPHTLCFDINSGCSGFVYGLYTVYSLLQGLNKPGARAILICGDFSSRFTDPGDRSVKPVFSDAVSATGIRFDAHSDSVSGYFNLETVGKGFDAIKVTPPDAFMRMQGIDVFNYTLRYVPDNIQKLITYSGIKKEELQMVVFHQANRLINETIRKKAGFAEEKVPYTLYEYGNTGSATIPLTLGCAWNNGFNSSRILISGFGVGFSVASALIPFSPKVFGLPVEL
jgi:3-oxoacyl-[acyl-carrier-protein] synthase-3